MKIVQSIAIVSMLAFAGTAYAEQPAAAPTAPAAPAAKAKPERSAKSMECSKQADTQNLHGKPRKHFMSRCKKS